jgi:hypothetical protein
VENEQTSFVLHFALLAMQMAQRREIFSSLGSQRSHAALVDKAQLHVGFTIAQIKQLG